MAGYGVGAAAAGRRGRGRRPAGVGLPRAPRPRRPRPGDPRQGNRRTFDALPAAEAECAARHDDLLSLVLLDIDHFKGVNDRFGHQQGDRVLMEVGVCDLGAAGSAEEMVAAADRMLYRAKADGRDAVRRFAPAPELASSA